MRFAALGRSSPGARIKITRSFLVGGLGSWGRFKCSERDSSSSSSEEGAAAADGKHMHAVPPPLTPPPLGSPRPKLWAWSDRPLLDFGLGICLDLDAQQVGQGMGAWGPAGLGKVVNGQSIGTARKVQGGLRFCAIAKRVHYRTCVESPCRASSTANAQIQPVARIKVKDLVSLKVRTAIKLAIAQCVGVSCALALRCFVSRRNLVPWRPCVSCPPSLRHPLIIQAFPMGMLKISRSIPLGPVALKVRYEASRHGVHLRVPYGGMDLMAFSTPLKFI